MNNAPVTEEQYQLWLQIKDVEINKLKYENEILKETIDDLKEDNLDLSLAYERMCDDYIDMMEWHEY